MTAVALLVLVADHAPLFAALLVAGAVGLAVFAFRIARGGR